MSARPSNDEPNSTVYDFADRILTDRTRHLERVFRPTRHIDIQAVHATRVSTRRLLAALELFEPILHPRRNRALTRQLHKLRRLVGPLRDADVFLERVVTEFPRDDIEQYLAVVMIVTRQRFRTERKIVAHGIRHRLERVENLVAKLRQSLKHAAAGIEQVPPLHKLIDEAIGKELACIPSNLPIETGVDELHVIRVACKRLRYVVEIAIEYREWSSDRGGEDSTDFGAMLSRLRGLQDRLGEIHDATTAIASLAKYSRKSTDEKLVEWCERRLREIEKRLDDRIRSIHQEWTGLST